MRHPAQGSRAVTERCNGPQRRELLRVGALSLVGLTLPHLVRADSLPGTRPLKAAGFGKARSCILLFLTGGPPQHETWDPKPEAPAEVRGNFKAISTNVAGIQVGELLPRTARLANQYSIVRSMATDVNAHTGSGYWMLTGHPHPNQHGESLTASGDDWPHFGAMVKPFLKASPPLTPVITLPEACKNNPGILWPGQNGGFLGQRRDPLLVECEPDAPEFRVADIAPSAALDLGRLRRRQDLLSRVNRRAAHRGGAASAETQDGAFQKAFDLLTSDRARRAFDLTREPAAVRERYGPHKFGQSCLLARRLIESGIRLVTVNWPREPGDLSVGNPLWDTHSDHERRVRDHLLPPFDRALAALLGELSERGLLDETLVVCMGEFGRTPKFNPAGGRDHWGHVFSVLLAGGGIRGGRVHGSSDSIGAYPDLDRAGAEDLHATLYHCLGIPPDLEVTDRFGRPHRACGGAPLTSLL